MAETFRSRETREWALTCTTPEPTARRRTGEPIGVDHVFLALERELAVFLRRARASSGEWPARSTPTWSPPRTASSSGWTTPAPQRATDLAGYFGVGKATMSRQLHALEELGLVAREPDPADGRASLVRLTDEGREPLHPGPRPAAAPGTPASSPPGTAPRSPNWPGCCTG